MSLQASSSRCLPAYACPIRAPRQPQAAVCSRLVTAPFLRCATARNVPGRKASRRFALESVENVTKKELQELTKLDYYQYIEDAGEDLVVIDFYTDWCGPCKMMYPKLVEMAEELAPRGVQIVKFNCNKFNKELGTGLGIRVAPTFFLYKGGLKVAEMTGAKEDKLRALIEENL